jgi:outer membrane protein assembly factor BamD (BamD/ComL family)
VREDAEAWKKVGLELGVTWTPTILVVSPDGKEQHRVEGFLPADDFLAQLALGLAKAAYNRSEFSEAERRYQDVLSKNPGTESAPEALYWAGVSRYKGTNDATALKETARAFTKRYRDTAWAKKASGWEG